jgi:hypothetical protein
MVIDIRIQLDRDKSLEPELASLLAAIPDHMLHNGEHRLRVPLGIYNVASSNVFHGFRGVLNALANGKQDEIRGSYMNMLHQLSGFIDSGYHMMKCLYPITFVNKPKKFAYQWIDDADSKVSNDYFNEIKSYKEWLATVLNKAKHEHAVFTALSMSTTLGSVTGYCLVSADEKGTIRPDPEVHPMYNDRHTAISYARDLRYHLVHFYHVCNEITRAMNKMINNLHGTFLTYPPVERSSESVLEVLSMIDSLPHLFFPDEYSRGIPQVDYDQAQGELRLRYPAYKNYVSRLPRYTEAKISHVWHADGVSRSLALPYFGGQVDSSG